MISNNNSLPAKIMIYNMSVHCKHIESIREFNTETEQVYQKGIYYYLYKYLQ